MKGKGERDKATLRGGWGRRGDNERDRDIIREIERERDTY